MTRKWFGYAVPGEFDDLDTFDDRTLASLVGKPDLHFDDGGNDNDDPYRVLPLDRWQDRVLKWIKE